MKFIVLCLLAIIFPFSQSKLKIKSKTQQTTDILQSGRNFTMLTGSNSGVLRGELLNEKNEYVWDQIDLRRFIRYDKTGAVGTPQIGKMELHPEGAFSKSCSGCRITPEFSLRCICSDSGAAGDTGRRILDLSKVIINLNGKFGLNLSGFNIKVSNSNDLNLA